MKIAKIFWLIVLLMVGVGSSYQVATAQVTTPTGMVSINAANAVPATDETKVTQGQSVIFQLYWEPAAPNTLVENTPFHLNVLLPDYLGVPVVSGNTALTLMNGNDLQWDGNLGPATPRYTVTITALVVGLPQGVTEAGILSQVNAELFRSADETDKAIDDAAFRLLPLPLVTITSDLPSAAVGGWAEFTMTVKVPVTTPLLGVRVVASFDNPNLIKDILLTDGNAVVDMNAKTVTLVDHGSASAVGSLNIVIKFKVLFGAIPASSVGTGHPLKVMAVLTDLAEEGGIAPVVTELSAFKIDAQKMLLPFSFTP